MRCPYCATVNRDGMTFCFECGEALDGEENPSNAALPTERAAPEAGGRRLALRKPRGWELMLGVLILAAVLGYSIVDGWNGANELQLSRAYRQAQTFETQGKKAEAVEAYVRAGNYKDAAQRLQTLTPAVDKLKAAYAAAGTAAAAGRWWDAAYQIRQAAGIEISYQDVVTRLNEARLNSGPIMYRKTTGSIEWSESDGTNARKVPYSDADAQIHAISPDGNWAIYSLLLRAPAGAARTTFLLNLRNGTTVVLNGPFTSQQSLSQALFRANSAGVYLTFGNRVVYYSLPAAGADQVKMIDAANAPVYLYESPAAIEPQQGLMALSRFTVSGTVTTMRGRLYLQDPENHATRRVPGNELGQIQNLTFSSNGRYMVYVVHGLPVSSGGHSVVSDTVVVRDLTAGDAGRHEIAATMAARDDVTQNWIEARFSAGDPPGVVVARGRGVDVQISEFNFDGSGERQIIASSSQQRAWGGLLRLSPGGKLLAGSSFSPTDYRAGLFTQPLDGGPSAYLPPNPNLLTLGWIGFTPDEHYGLFSRSLYREDSWIAVYSAALPATGSQNISQTGLHEVFSNAGGLDRHIAVLPDSQRLLVTHQGDKPGLYAMNIDGSDPILLVPNATELWTAGTTDRPLSDPASASRIFAAP